MEELEATLGELMSCVKEQMEEVKKITHETYDFKKEELKLATRNAKIEYMVAKLETEYNNNKDSLRYIIAYREQRDKKINNEINIQMLIHYLK